MWTTVVSEKGQVVIPAELRAQTDIRRGDRLTVELRDGALVLRPLPRSPLASLYGAFAGEDSLTAVLLREHAAEQNVEAREDSPAYHDGQDVQGRASAPPPPPAPSEGPRHRARRRPMHVPDFNRGILDAPVSMSEKIRRLAATGLSKAQIAQVLTQRFADAGIDKAVRYQFVYNVLARADQERRRRGSE